MSGFLQWKYVSLSCNTFYSGRASWRATYRALCYSFFSARAPCLEGILLYFSPQQHLRHCITVSLWKGHPREHFIIFFPSQPIGHCITVSPRKGCPKWHFIIFPSQPIGHCITVSAQQGHHREGGLYHVSLHVVEPIGHCV